MPVTQPIPFSSSRSGTLLDSIRSNGFVLGLFGAVALAFLFPHLGSRQGPLDPGLLSNIGVAVILFLQGLSLPLEKVKTGLRNWRLHVIIQAFTFLVFPAAGFALYILIPHVWVREPQAVLDGFLYLCVLPSTISTSVVLTSVANGNTAGALFNAVVSNVAGVIITPTLVHLLMTASGHSAPFGPLLLKISLLTLLPFGVGMALHPHFSQRMQARKQWVNRIGNVIVLFIVYTAFCDSVQNKLWTLYGVALTIEVFAMVVVLFTAMSLLIYLICRAASLNRANAITAYFCSVKKTLAMGVPLAVLIFGQRPDLSLILLPTMLYHPLQLVVNGLLANHWAKDRGIPL